MKRFCCLRLLATLGSFIVLSACMDIRAIDRNRGQDGEGSAPSPAIADFTATSTGQWNHFHVHIPSRYVQGHVMRLKQGLHGEMAPEPRPRDLIAGSGEYVDLDQVGGETFEYLFYSADATQEPQRIQYTVPLDLEVSSDLLGDKAQTELLLRTKRFGRLIFKPNAVIKTLGASWIVDAQEVKFDQTVFKSFLEDSTAAQGMDGRSGGLIEIHATRAEGSVEFLMTGENGGEGLKGDEPGPDKQGSAGEAGSSGEVHPDGGQALGSLTRYACSTRPGAGGTGGPGHQGNTGGRGKRGGDSGEVRLEIKDRQKLEVRAFLRPGAGGAGGPGGDGGAGGPGGAGGNPKPMGTIGDFSSCQPGDPGQRGAPGRPGDQGPQGAEGLLRKACFVSSGEIPSCF